MEPAKVAIIINSSSYDRVSYALAIAATSAAHLKDVHILFTYGAVCRLVKGKTDDVGEETDARLRQTLVVGIERGQMKKISETLSYLKGFGGTIYACSAAIEFHQLTTADLVGEVDEIIGISTFLDKTNGVTMLYV